MSYFKITNITNGLGKRHPRFNTPQVVETKSLLGVEKTTINPGAEIIIESEFLPVSVHQLRVKGLLIVQEMNKNDYLKSVKAKEAQLIAAEESVKKLQKSQHTKVLKATEISEEEDSVEEESTDESGEKKSRRSKKKSD